MNCRYAGSVLSLLLLPSIMHAVTWGEIKQEIESKISHVAQVTSDAAKNGAQATWRYFNEHRILYASLGIAIGSGIGAWKFYGGKNSFVSNAVPPIGNTGMSVVQASMPLAVAEEAMLSAHLHEHVPGTQHVPHAGRLTTFIKHHPYLCAVIGVALIVSGALACTRMPAQRHEVSHDPVPSEPAHDGAVPVFSSVAGDDVPDDGAGVMPKKRRMSATANEELIYPEKKGVPNGFGGEEASPAGISSWPVAAQETTVPLILVGESAHAGEEAVTTAAPAAKPLGITADSPWPKVAVHEEMFRVKQSDI